MKESCQIPKIIKAGERLINVLKYKHATLSKKKKKKNGERLKVRALIPDGRANSHRIIHQS